MCERRKSKYFLAPPRQLPHPTAAKKGMEGHRPEAAADRLTLLVWNRDVMAGDARYTVYRYGGGGGESSTNPLCKADSK